MASPANHNIRWDLLLLLIGGNPRSTLHFIFLRKWAMKALSVRGSQLGNLTLTNKRLTPSQESWRIAPGRRDGRETTTKRPLIVHRSSRVFLQMYCTLAPCWSLQNRHQLFSRIAKPSSSIHLWRVQANYSFWIVLRTVEQRLLFLSMLMCDQMGEWSVDKERSVLASEEKRPLCSLGYATWSRRWLEPKTTKTNKKWKAPG